MPFFILSILLQVAFVIHIVKTGRPTMWIWIVVMLPMAGALAYLIMEVLPELLGSRAGRQATRKIDSLVNPDRDINAASLQFSISDTVENSRRLAEECYNKGHFSQAKELYRKALRGIHADDPDLLYGLAKAEFMLNEFSHAKSTLDNLIAANPGYKNPDAHLLYARSLENLHETEAALHEYEALHQYFNGPAADLYYARFLKTLGKAELAQQILSEIQATAKVSGKHYNTLHKDILRQVKSEMAD